MPIINYVREHTRFMEYATDEHLTSSERLLWYALMHIMNARAQGNVWPEEYIRISNDRLLSYCPMKYDTMAAARNSLKQRGLIDFVSGNKNKLSPSYKINYFYPQYIAPRTDGYTEKSDNEGGNMGGNVGDNTGGNTGGNRGGNTGDFNINYTDGKERQSSTVIRREEDRTVTKQDARALYPRRSRFLSAREELQYNSIRVWMDMNDARSLFGAGMPVVEQILESDRFPMELVGHAMALTEKRNRMYERPLDNPAAYMQTLLLDWESRGYDTIQQIQEDKGDYESYGAS